MARGFCHGILVLLLSLFCGQASRCEGQSFAARPVTEATGTAFSRGIPLRDFRRATDRRELFGYKDRHGLSRIARRGLVLARFAGKKETEAIPAAIGRELAVLNALNARADVQFAELDVVLTRQFEANDPGLPDQWHHDTIRSRQAWGLSLGTHKVTLAIVDTPFQMTHPDLQPNAVAGWDIVTGSPITNAVEGFYHSTIAAGMAAAAINNALGVSGAANCWIMPIDIGDTPTTSDMHNAIAWAADHGVRVVNVSWDGAFSSVINEAGAYLKEKVGGMLFMSGVNGRKLLNYTNHPDIYAVSMTDRDDQPRSAYGDHIDFAAPGWEVYSTTTNSTYEADSGTSYSAPLAAGIAAWIMSVNPALSPNEIEEILKASAIDLGERGWDQTFGWGRIDFGVVAERTFATLSTSRIVAERGVEMKILASRIPGAQYRLLRREEATEGNWKYVFNARVEENANNTVLIDPAPPPAMAFYRVEITVARD